MDNHMTIIDTHAHFAVQENKVKEMNLPENRHEAKVFMADLLNMKKLVGTRNGLIEDSNMLEDYMECMETNNISVSWVHQLSFKNILGYDVLSNEQIAEAVRRYPQKLRGFAGVDPYQGKDAVKELEYAIKDLRLHGFKLNPNDYSGFDLNDQEKLYPLYEKCCELNIPVSVHTGITPGSIFRMRHNYPLLLDDVAVDFPELTIIVEHMGYPWNDLCYYMVGRHKNMYITTTAVANILIHTKPNIFVMELLKMISQFGSGKILWGSDWTVTPNVEEVLNFIKNISVPLPAKFISGVENIGKEDIENILGLNALRILK